MYLSLQAGTQDDVVTHPQPPSMGEACPNLRPSVTPTENLSHLSMPSSLPILACSFMVSAVRTVPFDEDDPALQRGAQFFAGAIDSRFDGLRGGADRRRDFGVGHVLVLE